MEIPSTYTAINKFIKEQENIINSPLEVDIKTQKKMRKAGIPLTSTQWDSLTARIQRETSQKYRLQHFNNSNRFKVIDQLLTLQRSKDIHGLEKLQKANDIISVYGETLEGLDGASLLPTKKKKGKILLNGSARLKKDFFIDMIEEIPGSNMLGTDDVDLVSEWDETKEGLQRRAQKLKILQKKIESVKKLRDESLLIQRQLASNENEAKMNSQLVMELEEAFKTINKLNKKVK
ncbi:hypothetical protein DAMA08_042980 [Martiniozyma asiatica (nom. inval.)]|nr:hypothetical protein DAMA08_042980 [Martiniozyma asiatica]